MSIFVFNQSKSPWIIRDTTDERTVVFSKMKRIKTPEREKTILLRIASDISALGNLNNTRSQLSKMVNMNGDVEKLVDKRVTINFDNFTYKPEIQRIIKDTANGKHILLIGLEIPDSILMSIEGKDTFILEGFVKGESLGLIVSLNTPESSISVTTYNKRDRKLTTEIFAVNNDLVVRDTCTTANTDCDGTEEYPIRKFRPARITNAVMVFKSDVELLEKIPMYSSNPNKYHTVVLDGNDLSSAIAGLKNAGYDAVTLFWRETDNKNDHNFHSKLRSLKDSFGVVYTVDPSGKVTKSKIR